MKLRSQRYEVVMLGIGLVVAIIGVGLEILWIGWMAVPFVALALRNQTKRLEHERNNWYR